MKDSRHPRRISKIFAIKYAEKNDKDMYEKIDDKMRVERERDMSTDLLAVSGLKEPKIFKIRTTIILKFYLALCTVNSKN